MVAWTELFEALQQLQSGNDEAFATIHQDFESRFRSFARSRMGRERRYEETDDAVQDTKLRLLHAFRSCLPDSEAAYRAIVFQHIRYAILDLYKRNRHEISKHASVGNLSRGESFFQQLPGNGGLHESLVADAIETLPDECREILIYRYWSGSSIAELAELFEQSESTVKRRLREAQVMLARTLKDA